MNTDMMKRVCVIGCGGAGKSTFSKTLALKINLPLIHLDTLFWKAGWIEEEQKIFDQKLSNALAGEKWIIDGNFQRTMPVRFEKTDTIFWLDYPTWRCLYGVFKRLFTEYGQTRSDMAEGCKESFDWPFLKYVLNFRKKTRPQILNILEENAGHCQIIIFQHPKDVQNWIDKNLC